MKRKSKSTHKTSYHYFALKILKESGRPMSAGEVTDRILKIKKIHGKTPDRTISAVLQRSYYISRVGYGEYQYSKNSHKIQFFKVY